MKKQKEDSMHWVKVKEREEKDNSAMGVVNTDTLGEIAQTKKEEGREVKGDKLASKGPDLKVQAKAKEEEREEKVRCTVHVGIAEAHTLHESALSQKGPNTKY